MEIIVRIIKSIVINNNNISKIKINSILIISINIKIITMDLQQEVLMSIDLFKLLNVHVYFIDFSLFIL